METIGKLVPTTGKTADALTVENLARRIAHESPTLERLAPDELEAVARAVIGARLVRDLDRKAELAGIDYQAERAAFLASAGRTDSTHTRRAYTAALDRLDAFASRRGISPLALTPRDADDLARDLARTLDGITRAPSSTRRDIAAISSFFATLERRYEAIRNPMRGTKARPAKRNAKSAHYPTDEEAAFILDALAPTYKAAAAVMLFRGLRVGSLPSLTLRGARFTARSKGKDISGDMPADALRILDDTGRDPRRPFEGLTETRIADALRYVTGKLTKAGTIAAAYSAHDFRHLYAVREYRKDRDIYRVSKLLAHASIQVTELYLRGLGEVD